MRYFTFLLSMAMAVFGAHPPEDFPTLTLSSALSSSTFAVASDFFDNFAQTSSLPTLPPHTPQFNITYTEIELLGSNGSYLLPIYLFWDLNVQPSPALVATYTHKTSFLVQTNGSAMGEMNLLCNIPSECPVALPSLPRYGWAWLYGAKWTTIPWLDCCSVTGDQAGYEIISGTTSVLLTEWQIWWPNSTVHPNRDAQSQHNFTLHYDPIYGYSVEVSAYLRINNSSAPKNVEFLNFLSPYLANPWPLEMQFRTDSTLGGASSWRTQSVVTAYANDTAGAAFTGFANNLLAGAVLNTYPLPPVQGAIVMTLGSTTGGNVHPSVAISYAGPYNFSQATCPTWEDQHQIVQFPPQPNSIPLVEHGQKAEVETYYVLNPTYSIRFIPVQGSEYILNHVTVLDHKHDNTPRNGYSNMLRIGVLETFETTNGDEPVPLTQPLRALVQAKYQPDYVVVNNTGYNGSTSSLAVSAVTAQQAQQFYTLSNQQPLIPLNTSTQYTFIAAALLTLNTTNGLTPSECPVAAYLSCNLYEADDFNVQQRLLFFNTTVLNTYNQWSVLSSPTSTFLSPPWASYADIRLMAVLDVTAQPTCVGAVTAYFDDFYFGPAQQAQ